MLNHERIATFGKLSIKLKKVFYSSLHKVEQNYVLNI